jgi:PRTRC genetic system ThiF family protein
MKRVHYTDSYLLNPPHKVTVAVAGAGGTGSQMLTSLARINEALVALGHPGIHVRCWDDDQVTNANIGRQMFSPADLGNNKAIVLISRINRYFGYDWEANPELFTGKEKNNITVTCIDTAAGRLDIAGKLKKIGKSEPENNRLYWLDLGNLQKTGQVVLGTLQSVKQPKGDLVTTDKLKTVDEMFPQLKKIKEKDQGPSCSLAEAIKKQDLFINSTLAQFGANLIWKLFREGMISYHGAFINLESFNVNSIKIS